MRLIVGAAVMRPVDKGVAPRNYERYQEAGPDLQARLGDYCSYCERRIEAHLAVEHVQPKSRVPELALVWSNFLLGCVNCNSSKGDTPINLSDFVWPDVDNTLRAFEFKRGGLIQSHPDLMPEMTAKARSTARLLGLDRFPGSPEREPTAADKRWLKRKEVWELAEKCKGDLLAQDTDVVRGLIVRVATGRGGFSIWWTVFASDSDMRQRLRVAFVGTHGACFDADENLVPRAGGQL